MSKAVVLLAPGFEEIETSSIVDILRRCGIEVTLTGLQPTPIEGSHGIKFMPDKNIDEVKAGDFDALICPGGAPGYENLRKDPRVIELVKDAFRRGKITAAICAAPAVLSDAGVLAGKKCTIYPGLESELKKGGGKPQKKAVVRDGNVITSMGPATAMAFAFELAKELVGERVVKRVTKETLADIGLKL